MGALHNKNGSAPIFLAVKGTVDPWAGRKQPLFKVGIFIPVVVAAS